MSVNKVILLGNLGKDPEVRYLEQNRVVAKFTLATSETFTNRQGERQTETEWHNIEVWDNLARIVEKYVKKGNQLYLEGKIRTERWTDKEGHEHTTKKIKATSLTLLSSRNTLESSDAQQNQKIVIENIDTSPQSLPTPEDELPF
jgi:single-strand DNA-binding protein